MAVQLLREGNPLKDIDRVRRLQPLLKERVVVSDKRTRAFK
jgi:hypothetical protein